MQPKSGQDINDAFVGLARTIYTRCNTVFLAGKSPYRRSCTVYIYGSG